MRSAAAPLPKKFAVAAIFREADSCVASGRAVTIFVPHGEPRPQQHRRVRKGRDGMAQDSSFVELMERLRQRDPAAAERIFRDFAGRLIALARSRLAPALRPKLDPEDIAQSALRSFFSRQAETAFTLTDWGGLWAVLVVITLRKCGHQVEYYRAACRDVGREAAPVVTEDSLASWQALGREPAPSEAAQLTELVERAMATLDGERERRMLELSLQGYSVPEISAEVGRSERTVHRVLGRVRQTLESMMDGGEAA